MNNCRRDRRQVAGFTLIELMIVLLILAILLAIAVPSFSTMIKKNNVEALQAKLSSAVATARSEAASRNVPTTICLTADGVACVIEADAGPDWSFGWLVFSDANSNGVIDAGEETIDAFENSHDGYTVKMSPDAFRLTFSTQGFLANGAASTVTVCDPDTTSGDPSTFARGLYIAESGLIVKTSDSDANGLHNDPNGGADLTCL